MSNTEQKASNSEMADVLSKLEFAGAGIVSLGELIRAVPEGGISELTFSGVAYLLEIVGDAVLGYTDKARKIDCNL